MRIRITIGGVLIMALLAGAGAFVFLQADRFPWLIQDGKAVVVKVAAFAGLDSFLPAGFRSQAGPAAPLSPTEVQKPISQASPIPVQEPVAPIKEEAAPPPVQAEPTLAPATAKKILRARRKKIRRKKVAVAAPVETAPSEAAPAAAAGEKQPVEEVPKVERSADPNSLIGQYVAIELKTGRIVKGILEAQTATEYTVQLPGLGSFPYPIDNVKGIKRAE